MSAKSSLSMSFSAFNSYWNASGQIPERSVAQGIIDRFGAIDNSEGGKTSRYSINLNLINSLNNSTFIENSIYFIRYNFNLYSNFTFFKNDSLHGDQIFQFENRNIYGYNGKINKENTIGNIQFKTTLGIGIRDDQVGNTGLSHTVKRSFLNDIKRGEIHETNTSVYMDETINFNPRLSLNLGLRLDNFRFEYLNKQNELDNNSIVYKSIMSPKLNLFYNINSKFQLYLSSGTGFHTNDTRGTIAVINQNTIPRSISTDFGTNFTLAKKLFIHSAFWVMDLESEYTYAGDDGFISPNDKTHRIGLDISARLQLSSWLYADTDINFAKPKFVNAASGQDYVPLAPPVTSVAGINVNLKNGINVSYRYRYLGSRPAIEDNSIVAKGYFITDCIVSYKFKQLQCGLTIENLFNKTWNEAQFATESKLKTDSTPITELHYTPGTPINCKLNVTVSF